MIVRIGKPAPDFVAKGYLNGEIKDFKLSDFRGKWVVLCFYPGDFTFVWPTEIAAVAAKYNELKSLGVEVIAISVDSPFVHKIWQEQELNKMVEGGIPFPMLTDKGGNIGRLYGVYDEDSGVDIRGRFLIDPDGIVVAMEILSPPVGRNVDELIRQIQAFQYVYSTDQKEVAPAGWRPGKKTLKPGPDLAGKVWEVWKVEDAF